MTQLRGGLKQKGKSFFEKINLQMASPFLNEKCMMKTKGKKRCLGEVELVELKGDLP